MKKKQMSRLDATPTPITEGVNFRENTGALPSPDAVERAVKLVTETQKLRMATGDSNPKKETLKGTQVLNVMIRKDLVKKLRLYAAQKEVSLSSVVNNALENFL